MSLEQAVHAALAGMVAGPKLLVRGIRFHAEELGDGHADIEAELATHVASGANDPVRRALQPRLCDWDFATNAPWAEGSEHNTAARRALIYDRLGIAQPLRKVLDECLPYWQTGGDIVIEKPDADRHWFTPEFRLSHDFYWTRYKEYLRTKRGRSDVALSMLDEGTTRVVERLADPSADVVRSTRGLVVGYVQSGKTANFTGVIAKAIDAGYRLIIVLSGTIDLLRNQTQRRLDMELAGVENIMQGGDGDAEHDYEGDPDWPDRFISYGRPPALQGSVDIVRLTQESDDFRSLAAGIRALQFEKIEPHRPLHDRANLNRCAARVIVIKKNSNRLARLLRDLKQVGTVQCYEVPALIIDDESDQASVNTMRPTAAGEKERNAINRCIVSLLSALPRAQYVGYTATPFANVFVDPSDAKDIYPRDFIISLDRPDGYMGVSDFHDLEPVPEGELSNEEAFIRSIPAEGSHGSDRLREAVDAFVLAGALKVYREQRKVEGDFRHHTMLIHESQRQADQFDKKADVATIWNEAAYASPATGARLEQLFEKDFRAVWEAEGKPAAIPFPSTFQELKPALGIALDRIREGPSPVLVVNGDPRADTPDFDKSRHVWKIVIGGAKLSRGYTVEGLTISYFRRRARTQDTLMQMGRWFGYRKGYRDLVRLYIGRQEPYGREAVDLYEAFEAICRDEEEFRSQLAQYSQPTDGSQPLTPMQVPALVYNSHPLLRPAARNKMFNAVVKWLDFDYREPTQQAVERVGREHNAQIVEELLKVKLNESRVMGPSRSGIDFFARWRVVGAPEMLQLLRRFRWANGAECLHAETEYLGLKPGPVDRWLLVLPQLQSPNTPSWKIGVNTVTTVSRTYLESRFGVFSEPRHRKLAEHLVGSQDALKLAISPPIEEATRTGVVLLYPTYEKGVAPGKRKPVMGFALFLPAKRSGPKTAFTVRIKSREDEVVVESAPAAKRWKGRAKSLARGRKRRTA